MNNKSINKSPVPKKNVNVFTFFSGLAIATLGPIIAFLVLVFGDLPCNASGIPGHTGFYCLIPIFLIPLMIIFGIVLMVCSKVKQPTTANSMTMATSKTSSASPKNTMLIILNAVVWFLIIALFLYGLIHAYAAIFKFRYAGPEYGIAEIIQAIISILISIILFIVIRKTKNKKS